MSLKDIARPKAELVTAEPTTPARELATLMSDQMVGSVVIAEDDEPVGIVTDRDLAMMIVRNGEDPGAVTAADCMTADPFTVEMDSGVADLCRTMREHSVRRVPVTDGGKLAGIVTADDLLVLIDTEMGDISEVIRAEMPAYSTA